MEFKVNAVYEPNKTSKRGNAYSEIVIDLGKFKKHVFLNDLEKEVFEKYLESLKQNA